MAVLIYASGWVSGWLYRHYAESWAMRHFWNHVHRLWDWLGRHADRLRHYGVDWPVVVLTVGIMLIGSLYYLDHRRWSDYLDCQDQTTQVLIPRSAADGLYNEANTRDNSAQARLTDVLHDIAVSIPLDGRPPTPDEQEAAVKAYTRLRPVSEAASETSRRLVKAQEHLAQVKADNPLPDCGSAPK